MFFYPTKVKVYLHDIELNFQKVDVENKSEYDSVVEEGNESSFKSATGIVLYNSADFDHIIKVLEILQEKNPKKLISVTFPVEDPKKVKKFFKTRYNYIKAGGGLVIKDKDFLFIYRLKKWDLPKGKLEKGEEIKDCALREVEEECSIKVKSVAKIGSTWHCYPGRSGWCVKKSTWYLMKCLDDSQMAPQIQEDIEDIAWVAKDSIEKYLANSYGTIKNVFHKARKKGLI